jgi:hypothetical protein
MSNASVVASIVNLLRRFELRELTASAVEVNSRITSPRLKACVVSTCALSETRRRAWSKRHLPTTTMLERI